jgi:Spy/CpxP family protein refolding chaperone
LAPSSLRDPLSFALHHVTAIHGTREKMRKLLTAVCATLAFVLSPASAQTTEDPALLLAKIQADKKGVVQKSLSLTPEEAKKFWPLYDKFQRELDVPHREYSLAVRDYIAAEKSMSDANATRLARAVLAASVTEAKMREKHFKEASKVLPGVKAARYMQIENKIQAIQRYETAKAIPLAH